MRTTYNLLAIAALAGVVVPARGQDAPRQQGKPEVELEARLRAEAAQLESGHASELFAALAGGDGRARPRLSDEQRELARRLDETSRSIIRAWLLRDQDNHPPAAELADRLGEAGAGLRRAVVRHSEAIVLEAILSPPEVQRVRSGVRLVAAQPLAGRYGMLPTTNDKPPKTAADFDWVIRSNAARLNDPSFPVSELFRILTAAPPGPCGLSAEQAALARRLDEMARIVCRGWLLRGMADQPRNDPEPPDQDLVDRLSERGRRVRASVVAHAEQIALESVLDPSQAERARRLFWHQRGVLALLDPELATRLKLSQEQREEIPDRIVRRNRVVSEAFGHSGHFWGKYLNTKLAGEIERVEPAAGLARLQPAAQLARLETAAQLARQAAEEAGLAVDNADTVVLDALNASQLKSLFRLAGKPAPAPPAARTKRPGRPG